MDTLSLCIGPIGMIPVWFGPVRDRVSNVIRKTTIPLISVSSQKLLSTLRAEENF